MKKKYLKAGLLSFLLVAVLAVGAFAAYKYHFSQVAVSNRLKDDLPTAVALPTLTQIARAQISQTAIPNQANWDVPFTVQAPNGNWDKVHEETCEEASVLMAQKFFAGEKIGTAAEVEVGLQAIIAWEMKNLGFYESTTADQTARIASEMFSLKTQIIENPTVEQIKNALADKKLVLVPAAGQQIGNPFYKQPGPLYHMIVLKGYATDKFISNDPGTIHGANYPYTFKTILDANHDWNGGDVANGAKRIIILWQ